MKPIHVVEQNPHWPQPFVLTDAAVCLRDAIRAAGYDSEHLVNRIDPQAYSIVLGGMPEFRTALADMDPQVCAVFNVEQLAGATLQATASYRHHLRHWLVLDCHPANVEVLVRGNAPLQDALVLPLVPCAGVLHPAPAAGKSVDVVFFGSPNARRQQVLDELRALGLSVEDASGAYGSELAPAIQRARLVLHVHFHEGDLFPSARVLQPVMAGVPIVCEDAAFSKGDDWSGSGIRFAPYGELAAACAALLRDPAEMARRAQATRAFATNIDFAGPFEHVLTALEHRALQPPRPASEEDRPLTNAEIEAMLAHEAELREHGERVPQPELAERVFGQGPVRRWMAWVVLAFILMGVYTAWPR